MISILIPVNNYDIVALVHSMKDGIIKVPEYCEIIIGDDGSSADFNEKYRKLECDRVKLIVSEKNIGRAAIRNRLAQVAAGDYLLFIDADAMIPAGTSEAYLKKWLPYVGKYRVICGGILYRNLPPENPDLRLRWTYGRHIEQKKASERNKKAHTYFSTFNFMIEKAVITKIRFNEEIKQYGHEDTLLGYQLKKAGIEVFHIDNGLLHEGLESNREFLNKTRLGIENLSLLYDKVTDKKTFAQSVKILKFYNKLKFLRLTGVFSWIFIHYRERMEKRLDSPKVSLWLFSLYKISMFCVYRAIHERKNILPVF
ncbi:MAG: glycosyltransferase family 2 protein [Bacteroidales bacterium]|nr:glycosyltransferase family 2 protein [Bacteroidales bacterium]